MRGAFLKIRGIFEHFEGPTEQLSETISESELMKPNKLAEFEIRKITSPSHEANIKGVATSPYNFPLMKLFFF